MNKQVLKSLLEPSKSIQLSPTAYSRILDALEQEGANPIPVRKFKRAYFPAVAGIAGLLTIGAAFYGILHDKSHKATEADVLTGPYPSQYSPGTPGYAATEWLDALEAGNVKEAAKWAVYDPQPTKAGWYVWPSKIQAYQIINVQSQDIPEGTEDNPTAVLHVDITYENGDTKDLYIRMNPTQNHWVAHVHSSLPPSSTPSATDASQGANTQSTNTINASNP